MKLREGVTWTKFLQYCSGIREGVHSEVVNIVSIQEFCSNTNKLC